MASASGTSAASRCGPRWVGDEEGVAAGGGAGVVVGIAVTGGLIHTTVGGVGWTGLPCTKRSGCARWAASRTTWRRAMMAGAVPRWTSPGVRSAMPLW